MKNTSEKQESAGLWKADYLCRILSSLEIISQIQENELLFHSDGLDLLKMKMWHSIQEITGYLGLPKSFTMNATCIPASGIDGPEISKAIRDMLLGVGKVAILRKPTANIHSTQEEINSGIQQLEIRGEIRNVSDPTFFRIMLFDNQWAPQMFIVAGPMDYSFSMKISAYFPAYTSNYFLSR